MMLRAVILTLLLAGCASANMKDTYAHGDMDRDGCIAYRCKAYCRESATAEQRAAFMLGTIDDGEAKQLRRFGWWLTGDTITTIAALSLCETAREANPILGSDPSALAVVAYSGSAYMLARHAAKRSPYWCSSARPIKTAANVRMAVSVSNALVTAVCP